MSTITIKTNAKDLAKILKKRRGALPRVGSETVNTAARYVERSYKKELDKFKLKNKFTKGAVQRMDSKPKGSKGMRTLSEINSVVGVRKMKGGKDHYLKKQEDGGRKRGMSLTKGGVPVPLDSARTGGSDRKPIKKALRLNNVSSIPVLKIGGRRGPEVNLGYNDKFNAKGGAQRWAIMYKYTGLSGRGKPKSPNPYGWDMSKQFLFQGMKSGLGIFKTIRRRVRMVRTLDKKSVRIKSTHKFEKSVDTLTPKMMDTIFKREALKYLKK